MATPGTRDNVDLLHSSVSGTVEPTGAVPPTTASARPEACDLPLDDPTLPQGRGERNLTWWRLAMITFVFTCSGPGGLEQAVVAGGPYMTVLGIFLVPIFYVMPQIFVVSELGAMMPTPAGNVLWVHRAFGRFAGFYNAWIFALTNMVDMAIYPVLFGDYVAAVTHGNETPYMTRMYYRIVGLLIGAGLSLLSAKDVSTVSGAGCISTVFFITLVFFASVDNVQPSTQWTPIASPIDYSLLGSSLLWLYTGWTALGALAGEAKNSRVLLHGMSSALVLDITIYLMSVAAAFTVSQPGEWQDGFFVTAYDRIIPGLGPFFGTSVVITSMTLYISAMICYSRSVWGMAEMGWAPKILGKQLSTGAPHISVLIHALVGFTLIWFDFGFIVQVEYTVAATSYILTYACFVRLRYTEPDTPRPYKTPGGMPFAWLITITKTLLMGGTSLVGLTDWRILLCFIGINAGVCIAYKVYVRRNPEQPPLGGAPRDSSQAKDGTGGASSTTALSAPAPVTNGGGTASSSSSIEMHGQSQHQRMSTSGREHSGTGDSARSSTTHAITLPTTPTVAIAAVTESHF
jgi:amino acid transporter